MNLDDTPAVPSTRPGDDISVARYTSYDEAQSAVDALSDAGFPVDRVSIVSANLRMIEQVTGRVTTGRAAAFGALDGGMFGLLVVLLIGLFATGPGWFVLLFWGIVLGAGTGALRGALVHSLAGGRRDFSAERFLAARHYDVVVEADLAGRAKDIISRAGLLPS